MCSGSSSPGKSTVPSGNNGNVSLMVRHYGATRQTCQDVTQTFSFIRWPGDPEEHVRAERVPGLDSRMLEARVQRHAESAHDGLRRLVEHGGHGPDLGQARAAERHAERGHAGLVGV